MHQKVHILLPLACDLNLVITSSRVVNSCSFMGIILFPYFNSTKGVKKTMASGNSRTRSSISPIWLDCSIRVYLNFAPRKHEKLNNLLPQVFLFLHKPISNRYLFILLCDISGEMRFFSHSHVLLVLFCFFLLNRLRVFNHVTDAVRFIYQILGQSNFALRKLSYFLHACIKRCAIAFHNLLSRHKPPPNRNSIEILSWQFNVEALWKHKAKLKTGN